MQVYECNKVGLTARISRSANELNKINVGETEMEMERKIDRKRELKSRPGT